MANGQNGAVQNLQMMLRNIAGEYDDVATVVPDGIFGPQTLESVQSFQQKFGIIPTGVVDFDTWNKIVEISDYVLKINSPGRLFLGFNENNNDILPGQTALELYVIQAMMKAVSGNVSGMTDVDITGTHDMQSVDAVRKLQNSMGIDDSGIITLEFYNNLTHLYEVYVTRVRI